MDFKELYSINVNDHTEARNGLTYLSWSWSWAEFKKRCPDATYTVWKDANGLPYVFDPNTGYMVYVSVTADGLTHEMWLPVMDSANRAMKAEAYTVINKWGKESRVEAATMFDINKTIMRALTKCLAMFGLGLYIYAGEDLPEGETKAEVVMNPVCENCGRPIDNSTKNDGSVWINTEIAAYTRSKFGKALCPECAKAENQRKQEMKKNG